MAKTVQKFQQRLRSDRTFRQRILAARKAGTLAENLVQEGYEFDLSQLGMHLPQVQTGIRAGSECTTTGSCGCAVINKRKS
jgi:hypothetical protein